MGNQFVLERLLGHTAGKRVLELGCGDGPRAVALARGRASVIAVDPDAALVLATRRRAQDAEVRVEVRTGDLADLAFLRGDSVDVAFAEGSLTELRDLGRVFRQVQRVLRAGAWFAFSLPHPMSRCLASGVDADGSLPLTQPSVANSYFDDEADAVGTHRIGDVFVALGRAGFQVDMIVEPEPEPGARGRALMPDTIIWRARKVGS